MLGRRDRLAAGRARPSSQGGGAGACRDCGRAPPAHLRGRWEPPGSAGSPERPPTPSLPASGGGASRGGGEVRRRESDLRAARGSLESKAQLENGVRLPTAHPGRGGAGRGPVGGGLRPQSEDYREDGMDLGSDAGSSSSSSSTAPVRSPTPPK
ncbi:hypothetical protein QTO34_014750 [Cnephaeus nilssonii]|uniref:Uncharacterized protein n=1 Tax=Cnephaeus nilssonii TaxID=3371016 RepID=A0AA40I6Z3_CNENI|nr:hypothetical protein QTO34_014750 [Eptesicus nilssonii]